MNCPSPRYTESRDFLITFSHGISLFTIPINLLTSYIIFFHTPKSMKPMQKTLLNAQIWASISDFAIGTLSVPYLFFPLYAGVPNGLLNYLGISAIVQTYLVSSFISQAGGVSVILVLEAQQNWICGHNAILRNRTVRGIVLSVNYIISFIFSIPTFLNIPDQVTTKLKFIEAHPCVTRLLLDDSVFCGIDSLFIVSMCYCTCYVFFTLQGSCYLLKSSFHILKLTKDVTLSLSTRRSQRKFFLAVSLQVILATAFLALPVSYFVFSMATGHYDQALNNIAFLLLSAHGFFTSICMLVIYEKYRLYLKNKLLCHDCAPKIPVSVNASIQINII